jgi:hypothetical protein
MTKKVANSKQTLEIPKPIVLTGKLIALISSKLATLYTAKLFTTPINIRRLSAKRNEQEITQNTIMIPVKKRLLSMNMATVKKKF